MSDWLTQAGYTYGEIDGVWCRIGFEGIAYSDGDEFEQRIEGLLRDSKDRTLFSSELAAARVDWPSYYHLSSTRANILRPFQDRLKGADVLEVGAGCGAITRFLGEAGANVCALEGSRRRARIARLRTADLENVTVVTDNFETFAVDRAFDVVTFVGVLEYASQFVGGEHPAATMLRRARSMLKPGGIVVIAIENQLGLKYFAGAPEDHVSRRMFGIEDRYAPDGVRTFGRAELNQVIEQSGFSATRFYAPFPDYKFPVTIFSEEGMKADDLDVSAMLRGSIFSDRQLTDLLCFDLLRAWDVVVRNKLGVDLANSFLIVASASQPGGGSALAWHFSTGRAAHFCKELLFDREASGKIQIFPRLINELCDNPSAHLLTIELPQKIEYVCGTPLSEELTSLLKTDGWSIEDVARSVRRYLQAAEDLIRKDGVGVSLLSGEVTVPGRYVDLIPQNIIQAESGELRLIDREWMYHGPVSVSWLVFRAFSSIFATMPTFGASRSAFVDSRQGFIAAVLNALDFGGTDEKVRELAGKEADVQSLVAGSEVSPDWWGPHVKVSRSLEEMQLPMYSFDDMVRLYERTVVSLKRAEDGAKVAEQELLVTRDQMQREEAYLKAQLAHVHEEVRKIEHSLSWRITKPLRAMKALLLRR